MEARHRLFSWVSASDGLKVPVGVSSSFEGLCWPRLVPAILPRGFNSVNQIHQQLPLPLFLLRQTRSTSFSCPRYTQAPAKVSPQTTEQALDLPMK